MRHTEESKNPSATGWRKGDIVQWLIKEGEALTEPELNVLTIPELIELSKKHKKGAEYQVDKILSSDPDKEIQVLRLPTKHCELNSIGNSRVL